MLKMDYNKINFYADSMVQMYVSKVNWWRKGLMVHLLQMPHTNVQLLVKRSSPMVEKCNMSRHDVDNLKIFVKSINTIIM